MTVRVKFLSVLVGTKQKMAFVSGFVDDSGDLCKQKVNMQKHINFGRGHLVLWDSKEKKGEKERKI